MSGSAVKWLQQRLLGRQKRHTSEFRIGRNKEKERTGDFRSQTFLSVLGLQVITQQLTVRNLGQAKAVVAWTSSNPAVAAEPPSASLAAGSERQFQVHIRGTAIGQLQAQLLCLVKHGSPQTIDLTAHVTGSLADISIAGCIDQPLLCAFGSAFNPGAPSVCMLMHWELVVVKMHAYLMIANATS